MKTTRAITPAGVNDLFFSSFLEIVESGDGGSGWDGLDAEGDSRVGD